MVVEKIGYPAMYEMLAEEASELSQAALKMARVLRGENPTPVTEEDAFDHLIEEYTDVQTCADELNLCISEEIDAMKKERFLRRWDKENG